ncbi:MAG TPA: hypothetical protein VMT39_01330 [Candidatus Bathyarchaeia archaeon]|nr:hypothetical protein [Candidatus Bathyarchaeia archaeon]
MNSIWPAALASLDDFLALPCESVGELEAVKSVDVEKVVEQLTMAAEAARSVRSFVLSVLPEACWKNREELTALLAEVQSIQGGRSRILALATELERGSIVHRRAVRVEQLNQLRKQAIAELRSRAESGGKPPTLPGPEASQWIDWACRLTEPEDTEFLETLRSGFARLDDFVADLEPDMWVAETASKAPSPNGEELGNLIQEVREQLSSRLLALATELERGSFVDRRARRISQLNQLREQAINELRSKAGPEGEPPTLPGPGAQLWIEWARGLKEPEDAESLETLRHGFAHLDDFIANLGPGVWRAGGSPSPEEKVVPEQPARRASDRPHSFEPSAGFRTCKICGLPRSHETHDK